MESRLKASGAKVKFCDSRHPVFGSDWYHIYKMTVRKVPHFKTTLPLVSTAWFDTAILWSGKEWRLENCFWFIPSFLIQHRQQVQCSQYQFYVEPKTVIANDSKITSSIIKQTSLLSYTMFSLSRLILGHVFFTCLHAIHTRLIQWKRMVLFHTSV